MSYNCGKCKKTTEEDDGFWTFRLTPELEATFCNDCYQELLNLIQTWLKEPTK